MIDVYFSINVEFLLCPTSAMLTVFEILPPILLHPSYRTTLTILLFLISIPVTYAYIFPSMILHKILINLFGKEFEYVQINAETKTDQKNK